MEIGGLQKLTLLDYPGKVSCTVFTKGCNFLCPFCHNAPLVNKLNDSDNFTEDEILAFLKKRQGILEGVCITGGEPLLHSSLKGFIKKVKALGYAVKLDTNGSFPAYLKELAKEKLIDYVAMDIKNSFEKYPLTSGCENIDIRIIEESIDFLLQGTIPYEFRTTVAYPLHDVSDIEFIAKRIEGADKYFIQNFSDSGNIIGENLLPIEPPCLQSMCKVGAAHTKYCKIR